ncbi:hypothetical protein [Thermus caldilimi]|uniref:hypothetical protein n=1 Tax=Thermus caldilimi TaxID=2483360 RepID=UPI001075FEC6|nr:hypothetical protein [Thermus caldilimi]
MEEAHGIEGKAYEKVPVTLEAPEIQRYRPSRYHHFHTLSSGGKLAYNALFSALAVLYREGEAMGPAKPCTG